MGFNCLVWRFLYIGISAFQRCILLCVPASSDLSLSTPSAEHHDAPTC